jgi:transcriptional regulator with XRE-family HTH domain
MPTRTRKSRAFQRFVRKLGSRIRRERVARAWTPLELAQRAGVGAAVIRRIESATGNPSLALLLNLAHALETALPDLLRG